MHTVPKNPPNVGSAMAALLKQVPAPLRKKIRDAWTDDLQFMFRTGMDAGEQIVFDAFEKHGINMPQPVAPSRPKLRVLPGGAK